MTHRTWKPILAGAAAVLLLTGSLVLGMGHGKGRTKIDFRLMMGDPSSSQLFAKIDVSAAISSNANIFPSGVKPGHGHGKKSALKHGENGNGDDQGNGNGKDGASESGGKDGHGNKGGHGGDGNENDGDDDDNGGITSNGNVGHHGKSGNFALAGSTITLTIGSASFSGTADAKGRVSTPFNAKLTADGNILELKANGLNLEELFPIDPADGAHQVTVEIKVSATTVATSTLASQMVTLSDQNVTFFYTVKNGRARGRNF